MQGKARQGKARQKQDKGKARQGTAHRIRVEPELSPLDVTDNRHLHVDVQRPPLVHQSLHQTVRVAVHAHPISVDEDLGAIRLGDHVRRNLVQVFHRPLFQKLLLGTAATVEGKPRRPGMDKRGECEGGGAMVAAPL